MTGFLQLYNLPHLIFKDYKTSKFKSHYMYMDSVLMRRGETKKT